MRKRYLGLVWFGLYGLVACGGRSIVEGSVADPFGAGAPGTAGAPSDAGSPSSAGAPYSVAGGPSYAGTPSYSGAPHGGAPAYGGAPALGGAPSAGAPSYAGAPAPPDQPWEVQQLARIRAGIVGTWYGVVTNPWTSGCKVQITFFADGHYSAHSPADACVVFYYGTNDDSPEKTYFIDDVTAAAEGAGMIQFYFGPGDTNEGALRAVALSPDSNSLSFRAYKDQYGPLVFDLHRI